MYVYVSLHCILLLIAALHIYSAQDFFLCVLALSIHLSPSLVVSIQDPTVQAKRYELDFIYLASCVRDSQNMYYVYMLNLMI